MKTLTIYSLLLSVVSSESVCGLAVDPTSHIHQMASLDMTTGDLSVLLTLPDLDAVGEAFAGAAWSSYYATSESVEHESDCFLVNLNSKTSNFLRLVKPRTFGNLTRFGIANLNVDPKTKQAIALVVGIDVNWDWYCFFGPLKR